MKKYLVALHTILVISLIGCSTDVSTTSARDVSMNQQEDSEPVKVEEVTYSKFTTFLDDTQAHIQPGAGGVLIEEDGCLLVQEGSEKFVPIFPNSSTSWDENSKTLTTMGRAIKLGDSFILAGGTGENTRRYGGLNFVKKANPQCVVNRNYMLFWGT